LASEPAGWGTVGRKDPFKSAQEQAQEVSKKLSQKSKKIGKEDNFPSLPSSGPAKSARETTQKKPIIIDEPIEESKQDKPAADD